MLSKRSGGRGVGAAVAVGGGVGVGDGGGDGVGGAASVGSFVGVELVIIDTAAASTVGVEAAMDGLGVSKADVTPGTVVGDGWVEQPTRMTVMRARRERGRVGFMTGSNRT